MFAYFKDKNDIDWCWIIYLLSILIVVYCIV